MARYEEARNRAQEPSSQTKKMVNPVPDRAEAAKEDCQKRTCQPIYTTGGGGGSSGPDGDDEGDPTDQDRDSSSERGVMDFLSEGEGAEEDHPKIHTRKLMMGHLGVTGGDKGPGVTQDPGDQKDPGDPRTDGTQGNSQGTVFHWPGRHNPTIPECEYDSSGKFIAVCRGIPILVDANSAESKPKYGGPPKFNSGSARCADHRTKQIGRKYPEREFDKLFNAIPI